MNLFERLLVDVIVLCVLGWFCASGPLPAPFEPVRWVLWLILVVVAFAVLLPFLGVHILGL